MLAPALHQPSPQVPVSLFMGAWCRSEGPEAVVASLVDLLQGPAQGQVYATQGLVNLAADPACREQMVASGAVEVCGGEGVL